MKRILLLSFLYATGVQAESSVLFASAQMHLQQPPPEPRPIFDFPKGYRHPGSYFRELYSSEIKEEYDYEPFYLFGKPDPNSSAERRWPNLDAPGPGYRALRQP